MSHRIVNAYTISPNEIKAGDVMLFVVKAMVVRPGEYRLYRCKFESEDIPQGDRIYTNEDEVCEALFPSLAYVAEADRT
jgi:hypothetical protein